MVFRSLSCRFKVGSVGYRFFSGRFGQRSTGKLGAILFDYGYIGVYTEDEKRAVGFEKPFRFRYVFVALFAGF